MVNFRMVDPIALLTVTITNREDGYSLFELGFEPVWNRSNMEVFTPGGTRNHHLKNSQEHFRIGGPLWLGDLHFFGNGHISKIRDGSLSEDLQVVMEMSRRCRKQMTRHQGNSDAKIMADLGLKTGGFALAFQAIFTSKVSDVKPVDLMVFP